MAYGKIKADTLVYDNSGSDVEVTLSSLGNKANLASPTFTGTVTIPTPAANDNTTKAASTAYVQTELGDYLTTALGAPKASPTFTGTVNAAALTLSGNLQVNGTTTTVASSTMTVADKNIEIAQGAANDAAADGGGITLKSGDGDKTITWINGQDAWVFNQNITVTSGGLIVKGVEGGAASIWLTADEGDDNADYWRIQHSATTNSLVFANYTTGSYTTTLKLNPNGALEDSKGDVRKIVKSTKTSAYTLVAADAGKATYTDSGVTVANNVFGNGDATTIINSSGSDITITQGSGVTIYNSADAATGNRTLAARGMATLWFADPSTAYISGAGLS